MIYHSIAGTVLSLCTLILASEVDKDSSASHLFVSDSQKISQLDELVVSGIRPAANTASTKTLLADDFIGKYQDLASLLGTVSGVTVYRTGGLGAYSTVQIRGSAANQVQIYLDGIPLNTANGGAVDIGKIPLGSLQEITIHKSSAPLQLIGSNAGGIIELWSKPDDISDITNASGELGSFGYRKAGALISKKTNNVNHWFSVDYSHSENNFPYDWDLTAYKSGDEIEKRMDNQYFTGASGQYGLEFKSPGKRYRVSSHLSFNHSENGIFWITKADSNDGFIRKQSISGLINCQFYLGKKTDICVEFSGNTQNILSQRRISNARKRETDFPFAEISATLMHTFNDWLNTKAIIASEYHSYLEKDLWNHSRGTPYSRRLTGRFGMEVSCDLLQRFRGNIKGVLRYEIDSTNGISYLIANNNAKSAKTSDLFPSMEAAFNFDLFDPVSLFSSCHYGSRSPGFSEKFASTEATHGNQELQAEKRFEYDAGIILKTKKLRMSFTGYANRVIDKILFVKNSQSIFVPMNFNEVHGFGLEWDCDFSLNSHVSLVNMMTLMKNQIYSDVYPSWNGKYEPFLPSFQNHSTIDIKLWKLSFRHQCTFSNGYYTESDNVDFFKPVPELGLALSFQSLGPLSITYRLDNYLKGKLYESESDGKSVEHTQIYHGSPKPGRMHTVTLQVTF